MGPKIQIRGYTGPAVIVVSCVTHDSDKPKAHPHMLVSPASVGRDGCKKGVCTQHVSSSDMTVEFQHLGIQCKRKRDIQKALDERKSIRVDPFRQGFEHANSPGNIDLNAVRLCFQAFLENPETPGKFTRVVPPVCSKPIFDAKAKKELQFTSPQTNSELADLNQVLAAQEYCQYGSPYSDNSQSSYDNDMPQQSPDPQGLANMNIASPIGIQSPDPTIESILGTEHGEVENMSQELKGLSFESPGTNLVEPLNIEAAQQQQQRSAGKRSAKGAELESGSNVVPRFHFRQMERQQSNTLHTPNISNTLSTGDVKFTSGDLRDLSAVLKNCPEVNQL